jgi:N-acetylmuramoyl-L-alanine amidase
MTLSGSVVSQYVGRRGQTLLVRFPRGRLSAPYEQSFAQGPVQNVRLAQHAFSAELTVALEEAAGKETVSYDPMSREFRVWVPAPPALVSPFRGPSRANGPEAAVDRGPRLSPVVLARRLSPRARRPIQKIMVDPGHGGRDVGALGLTGLVEKDVDLKLARILAERLRSKGYEVALTRSTDVFIPLSERSQMANGWGADLFVSVHCNSSLSRKARGFEVYFLSEKATDAQADAVARTENSVLVLERSGKMEPALRRLLLSMAQNQYLNEASRLCAYMARRVGREIHSERSSVKQADFYVLREAGMPAVLVEFEYLSNPVAEARLRSRSYCQRLVSAVCGGIISYEAILAEHADKGTS